MAEVELRQIGTYHITELLHESSTSVFYRSKHRKKDVIIKRLTIPLSTNEQKEAFLWRARQLKKLKERRIVHIIDVNFDGDYGYLVMEYGAAEDWRPMQPGTRFSPSDLRGLLSPLADALHYAHVHNIWHGNLHPAHVLTDGRNNILLTEFALTPPASSLILDDDTPAIPYMAPEALCGQASAASDQYALAVMVYEWLCGQRPYPGTTREQLLQQHEQGTFPMPRSLNNAISATAEQVIMQALAPDPEKRFPHTHAFSTAYLNALMGLPIKVSESPRQRAPIKDATTMNGSAIEGRSSMVGTSFSGALDGTGGLDNADSMGDIGGVANAGEQVPLRDLIPKVNEPQPTQQASGKRQQKNHTTPSPIAWEEQLFPEEDVDEIDEDIWLAGDESSTGETRSTRLQAKISNDLRQGGILSRSLLGYEERPAQIEMATLVARSLTENVPAVIEAGTGTGKTLSYLVPVVRSGKIAIVSTANKALQEQLFYKDIPFIQRHIKRFNAALVKGVSNYVCLDRVEAERNGLQFYAKNRDFLRLLDVINDPDSTFLGDFETLGFRLPADMRSHVATDSDQCAWSKCNFFGECYVRQMREQAELAQVIVVNHTLLLLDAAMGGYLLPERDVIILDEAHHLEEEATRSFTLTVNPLQIQLLLAQRMLKDHSQLSLQSDAFNAAQNTWMRLEQVTNLGHKGRINLDTPFEEGLHLATAISNLADSLHRQRPKDLPEKEGQLYDKLLKRTKNLADSIRTIFSVDDLQKFVYYVERAEAPGTRGGLQLQACAAPLDVTSWLKERLFDKCNVICTSATLATVASNPARPAEKGPNFTYFRQRVGLDPVEHPEILERILPLAFDYERNALLYIPRDLPQPTFGSGSDDYMKSIAREMYKLVKLSRGRAFLLFSSKRMLERAYELMSPHLPYPLLKQGDMTRLELTRRFREEEGSVLFGLKSFWEGVDIAGDALSLVVIDKLPFDPPDDPVHEARVGQMKAAGEDWFGNYVLPQAVLRLKQGIGRLLRTRDDRGVMAILDTRLHTKGYGRLLLNALPPARRTNSLRDVERFFAE